nr:AEC family transporter [Zophobihabitans entericus]
MTFIISLWSQFHATLPLFILIFVGYALIKIGKWPQTATDSLTRFTFSVSIPVMLFKMMSNFSEQDNIDYRLLYAFFGSCLIVFLIGRFIAKKCFKLDGVSGSVFSIAGVFSNNVLVGLPIAIVLLGPESVPCVALVLVFNTLILWTLVTVSVEWARVGQFSLKGLTKIVIGLTKNPVIIGIITGLLFNFSGLPMPEFIDKPTSMISTMAAPLSLLVLGMGLAEYRITDGLHISSVICFMKLLVQPLVVWLLALALGLPTLETNVVVLLGSMSIGINVYLMARKFDALKAPIASSLIISTVLSSVTTPLILTIIALI